MYVRLASCHDPSVGGKRYIQSVSAVCLTCQIQHGMCGVTRPEAYGSYVGRLDKISDLHAITKRADRYGESANSRQRERPVAIGALRRVGGQKGGFCLQQSNGWGVGERISILHAN
jgi:hypothetical protein